MLQSNQQVVMSHKQAVYITENIYCMNNSSEQKQNKEASLDVSIGKI